MAKKARSRKHGTIFDLGPDKVAQIDAMLVQKKSGREVTDHIQKVWKLYTDVKPNTLTKQIWRYKKDVLNATLITTVTAESEDGTKVVTKAVDGVYQHRIDALDTLTELVVFQLDRMNKLKAMEEKMPTVLNQLGQEIGRSSALLKQLSELQFDMGLLQRVPRTIRGEIQLKTPEVLSGEEALAASMQEADKRVNATHRVFDLMKELNGETALDGEYESSDE